MAALCLSGGTWAAGMAVSPDIRVNQVGFYPQTVKIGAVVNSAASTFFVATPDLADTVLTGDLGARKFWPSAGDSAQLADFSAVTAPGRYVLGVPGMGVSHPFSIDKTVNVDLSKGAIRAFYYQRASSILLPAHAGKWSRAAGHPDNRVFVHPSAANATRPAETPISSIRGWYDAGDYNKYVVNSGISTYTLLALYRHYPDYFDTLNLNIPESGNALPDLLDETLWNLRWMMTMQDPADGGVYHKLTSPEFSGSVQPAADNSKRYVVQKSVTAALDLAATAAYASRLFRKFEGPMPGFADSALNVARKAWSWARANPTAFYVQSEMNKTFTPAVNTGEYGDRNASDEFFWAGSELYLATREDSFFVAVSPTGSLPNARAPSWGSVGTLGLYSLSDEINGGYGKINADSIRLRLNNAAKSLRDRIPTSPYGTLMVDSVEFNWGSNSNAGNQGMLLIQAFRATGDSSYLKAAVPAMDYLLGRNATGFSFVTGYGSKQPMNPHHRPSESDALDEPVPGMLVGGPNKGREDKCVYPSTLPAKSYSDTQCSYASNEIAINWNAPLAYVSGALQAIYGMGLPSSIGIGKRKQSPRAGGAYIAWDGKRPRVVLPAGWKGQLEIFDMKGSRVQIAAMDTAGSLWIYRLKAEDGKGRKVTRTGTFSPFSTPRIDLAP